MCKTQMEGISLSKLSNAAAAFQVPKQLGGANGRVVCASVYKKTDRVHTDAKKVRRVVYVKEGGKGDYVKKRTRAGAFRYIKVA